MSGLCLAGAGMLVALGVDTLTLRWRHSVEHTLWQEQWRRQGALLLLERARVQGSGAGMEPPADAVREGEAWVWRPALPPLPVVTLRRSGTTADWQLCREREGCQPLDAVLPVEADPVTLLPCP